MSFLSANSFKLWMHIAVFAGYFFHFSFSEKFKISPPCCAILILVLWELPQVFVPLEDYFVFLSEQGVQFLPKLTAGRDH